MPEIPDVTPYVPTAPTMPDLPAEIPWPPSVDWPDLPGPWVPPDWPPWDLSPDGPPKCFIDFSNRFMRLIIAIAVHRAELGQVPGYPPFDLRTMGSFVTPQIVNLAAMWLTTIWNTHTDPGEDDVSSYYPHNGDGYKYNETTGARSIATTARGGFYSGDWYHSYMLFKGSSSLDASKITKAYLRLNSAVGGTFNTQLDCYRSATPPAPPNDEGEFGTAWVSKTGHTVDFNELRAVGSTNYSPYITESVKEVIGLTGFNGTVAVMLSSYGHVGTTSVEFQYYFSAIQYSTLFVHTEGAPVLPPMLPLLNIGEFSCSQMLAWMALVEGICWPHL